MKYSSDVHLPEWISRTLLIFWFFFLTFNDFYLDIKPTSSKSPLCPPPPPHVPGRLAEASFPFTAQSSQCSQCLCPYGSSALCLVSRDWGASLRGRTPEQSRGRWQVTRWVNDRSVHFVQIKHCKSKLVKQYPRLSCLLKKHSAFQWRYVSVMLTLPVLWIKVICHPAEKRSSNKKAGINHKTRQASMLTFIICQANVNVRPLCKLQCLHNF